MKRKIFLFLPVIIILFSSFAYAQAKSNFPEIAVPPSQNGGNYRGQEIQKVIDFVRNLGINDSADNLQFYLDNGKFIVKPLPKANQGQFGESDELGGPVFIDPSIFGNPKLPWNPNKPEDIRIMMRLATILIHEKYHSEHHSWKDKTEGWSKQSLGLGNPFEFEGHMVGINLLDLIIGELIKKADEPGISDAEKLRLLRIIYLLLDEKVARIDNLDQLGFGPVVYNSTVVRGIKDKFSKQIDDLENKTSGHRSAGIKQLKDSYDKFEGDVQKNTQSAFAYFNKTSLIMSDEVRRKIYDDNDHLQKAKELFDKKDIYVKANNPLGTQFEDLCGNGQLDRGEQCDYGYDCPNGMVCSEICDCIYSGQGNLLPPKNDSENKTIVTVFMPEEPKGFFARFFASLIKPFAKKSEKEDKNTEAFTVEETGDNTDTFTAETGNNTGIFAAFFSKFKSFFGKKENQILADEGNRKNEYKDEDSCASHGLYSNDNCDNSCQRNQKCDEHPEKANCYFCRGICANDEFYKDEACKGLCVEGVNKCLQSENNPDCYWCKPTCRRGEFYKDPACANLCIKYQQCVLSNEEGPCYSCQHSEKDAKKSAPSFKVDSVAVFNGSILFSGTFEGDFSKLKYVRVTDLLRKSDIYPLVFAKNTNKFKFAEKFERGRHVLAIEGDLENGEKITSSPIYADVEPEKCSGKNIYSDSNCLNECNRNQKCSLREDVAGCYGCESVCGAGEYYNDQNCGGQCTQGVNECANSMEKDCYWCRPLAARSFNFELLDTSQDYKRVSSIVYGHSMHFVVASSTSDVRQQLPITITMTVSGEEVFKAKIPNEPSLNCRDSTGCSIDGPIIKSEWGSKIIFLKATNKDGVLMAEYRQ